MITKILQLMLILICFTIILIFIWTSTASKYNSSSTVDCWNKSLVIFKFNPVGYGNNIFRILTAFMYTIITKSDLVIDWPEVEAFIEPPFENIFRRTQDLLEINDTSKIYQIHGKSINSWNPNKTLLLNETVPENYVHYYVPDITAYFFDLCSNPNVLDKLASLGLVRQETIQRALNSLDDENIIENQKIEYFLLIGFEYAGSVLNKYWKINTYMQQKVDDYYSNNFQGAYVIGMQFRMLYLNEIDIQTFFECARSIENAHATRKYVKWYISSDDAELIKQVKKKFGHKILSSSGTIGHIALMRNSYQRTILDIELLSRCDELIITGGSTFGFIPALMNQRRPYYVNGQVDINTCQKFKFFSPPKNYKNYSIF